MKRILIPVLAGLALLGLAACHDRDHHRSPIPSVIPEPHDPDDHGCSDDRGRGEHDHCEAEA